jgi:hypothetical protein
VNRKVKYDACGGEVTSVTEIGQEEAKPQPKTEPGAEPTEEYVKPVPVAEKVGRYMKDLVFFPTSVSTYKLLECYSECYSDLCVHFIIVYMKPGRK